MNKGIIIILSLVAIIGLVIFFIGNRTNQDVAKNKTNGESSDNVEVAFQGWRGTELVDARTDEKFRIIDFEGRHVIIESFAVWCPTCLKQQNEVKKMSIGESGDVVHIGLDTDPNEDSKKVRDFVIANDFDWLYAISPIDMTRDLVDEFGLGIVNASQAPMIHICPNGDVDMLKRGVKTVEELNEIVANSCSK